MSLSKVYILTLSTMFVSFIKQSSTQTVVNFRLQSNKLDKRLRNATIQTIWNVTLAGCARECYYLNACKSMNFKSAERFCELNARKSLEVNPDDWEKDSSFVFSEKTDWPKEVSGTCSNEPCSSVQKCYAFKPPECKAWCGDPVDVRNANYDIGDQTMTTEGAIRRYTCEERHVMTSPDNTVTCQPDSTWSPVMFQCIADCGTPPAVAHAVISPGLGTENQTRTYTCVGRYVHSTAQKTIECQMNTYWSDILFKCIANCGTPPDVQYAAISSGSNTENQTRTYTCQGHTVASAPQTTIVCQMNTYWSAIPFNCVFTCASGWTKFYMSCYKVMPVTYKYIDAKAVCEEIVSGGHLVHIRSQEVNDFLSTFIPADSNMLWIGFNRSPGGSSYVWTDNSPLDHGFQNWQPNQPTFDSGYECGIYVAGSMYCYKL